MPLRHCGSGPTLLGFLPRDQIAPEHQPHCARTQLGPNRWRRAVRIGYPEELSMTGPCLP